MRLRVAPLPIAIAAALSVLAPLAARAACRTETCPLPPNFNPSPGQCSPDGPTCEAADGGIQQNLPVFWRSQCVGYSVQEGASKYVSLPDFEAATAASFATWTNVTCGSNPVGISTFFLGPVECADTSFRPNGPNQHQIVFYDEGWPYEDAGAGSSTVALTRVTFNLDTGELYDAIVEINTTNWELTVGDGGAGTGFDLQAILTHEAGHFLGLAHTPDPTAMMYYSRDLGAGLQRTLTADDVTAICSAYPGDGTRIVSPLVADGGVLKEDSCTQSVFGGFSSACTFPPSGSRGCDIEPSGRTPAGALALPLVVLAGGLVRFGRRRAPKR